MQTHYDGSRDAFILVQRMIFLGEDSYLYPSCYYFLKYCLLTYPSALSPDTPIIVTCHIPQDVARSMTECVSPFKILISSIRNSWFSFDSAGNLS